MKMIATKTLRYGTRSLRAGDEFEASPRDARVLQAIGKAEVPPPPVPAPKPRPARAKPADPADPTAAAQAVLVTVRAEDPPPSPEAWLAAAVPVSPDSDPPVAKRTYTRRDLLAE